MIKRFVQINADIEAKITLYLNHLLVIYSFLIPIHNGAKSSLLFTMLILFLYRRNYWFYLKEALSNRIVQAFLLFYFFNSLGFLYSENIKDAMSHMDRVKYLLFPLLFMSFLDKRFAFRVLNAFIFGMLVAEIFSYLIHFNILPYKLYIGGYDIYETEVYSPAPFLPHDDHNIGLSLVVGFLLYQLLNKKDLNKFIKLGTILFIISASFNMSFIASRTGYVVYLFVILLVFILSYKKKFIRWSIPLIIFLTLFSYIIYNTSNTVNYRIDQTINSIEKMVINENYNSSFGLRIGFTVFSLETIKNNILFGVGIGDHMDEVRNSLPKEHQYIKKIYYPHNTYTQILLQIGVVGLISFFYLVYQILVYKHTDRYKKNIMILFTLSMLIFIFPGTIFSAFELPLFAVIISSMIASKEYNIKIQGFDKKILYIYMSLIALFLVIGITR